MPYWGSKPTDNDYAFDAVGVNVLLIKQRMFQDAENVIEKSFPEQGIIASLQCLRLLAIEFPKNVRLQFGRKDFEKAKAAFEQWYDKVQQKLPAKYREAIRTEAEMEFDRFVSEVLSPPKNTGL